MGSGVRPGTEVGSLAQVEHLEAGPVPTSFPF